MYNISLCVLFYMVFVNYVDNIFDVSRPFLAMDSDGRKVVVVDNGTGVSHRIFI